MHILQNIIIANNKDIPSELYFRYEEIEENIHPIINNKILKFNTFFGSFSLNTWFGKAELDKIGITLEFSGSCQIRVFQDDGVEPPKELYKKGFEKKNYHTFSYSIDKLKNLKGILYPVIESNDVDFLFHKGFYWTSDLPRHDIKIAIIMPTFKRENYVFKNIEILSNDVLQNSNEEIELFIIDNGKTINIEKNLNKVKVFQNLNYGGSGGFTRGVIEALKESRFTHVLFCDDDIIIEPESIKRLHSLLKYIQEKSVVGGGMLKISNKSILHEVGANLLDSGNITGYKYNGIDLKNVHSLHLFDQSSNVNYFAWVFFACPMNAFVEEGLPLPFFLNYDDIEFGYRLSQKGYELITMLGLGVWHEDFDKKYSSSSSYYVTRNFLITIWCHHPNIRINRIKLIMKLYSNFIARLKTYRYENAEFLLKGIQDALKGPKFIKELCPQNLHSHFINTQTELKIKIKENELIKSKYNKKIKKTFYRKIRIILSILTINGHLLPNILMFKNKKHEIEYCVEHLRSYRIPEIFRYPKIIFYEPSQNEGVICCMNRKRCFMLLFYFIITILKLFFTNSRMINDWKGAYNELRSFEFWNKYLKLN
jgi:GT2 family glycosyltransferase